MLPHAMKQNNPTPNLNVSNRKPLGWQLWLFGFAILGIVITTIFRLITPIAPIQNIKISTPQFISTNFNNTQTNFKSVNYSGAIPNLPQNLPILAASQTELESQKITAALISKYGLIQHPKSVNVWLKDEYSLVKNPTDDTFVLNKNLIDIKTGKLKSSETGVQTKSELIDLAKSFMAEYNLSDVFQVYETEIKYYFMESFELEEVSDLVSDQSHILIPFIHIYLNYPVLSESQKTNQVSFLMTTDGLLNKFSYPIHSAQLGDIKFEEKLISLDQALIQIQDGQGSIVFAQSGSSAPFAIEEIQKADFKNLKIEYRVDGTSGLALPFYRFEGIITNTAGDNFEASVITPAVATTPAQ